jgi:hypothetical protein
MAVLRREIPLWLDRDDSEPDEFGRSFSSWNATSLTEQFLQMWIRLVIFHSVRFPWLCLTWNFTEFLNFEVWLNCTVWTCNFLSPFFQIVSLDLCFRLVRFLPLENRLVLSSLTVDLSQVCFCSGVVELNFIWVWTCEFSNLLVFCTGRFS